MKRHRKQDESTKKSKPTLESEGVRKGQFQPPSTGISQLHRRPNTNFRQPITVDSGRAPTLDLVSLVEQGQRRQAQLIQRSDSSASAPAAPNQNQLDMDVPPTYRPIKRPNEQSVDDARAGADQHSGEGGAGGVGGGSSGDPIPMAMPQHQRAVDHFTIKAAGTTFVGPGNGTGAQSENNTWHRFPWEIPTLFLTDWTVHELVNKYTMWKCEKVNIVFKNPLCIQEIGSTTSALATAGQNLHANLYAYQDNMYIEGVRQPFPGQTAATITSLMKSWKHHGYDGATPVKLPTRYLSDTAAMFQNNWPDVKQCGMGPGKSLGFSWNVNNKYWRPMETFKILPQDAGAGAFSPANFPRWDQRFGSIGHPLNSQPSTWTAKVPASLNTTAPSADPNKFRWSLITDGGFPYADPDPMPGIYLQLQPQLGAISTGVSDSICQLQWELEVDIVCTGRLPRMTNDQNSITDLRDVDSCFAGKNMNSLRSMPLFYDIIFNELDGTANTLE